jgi:hypothetical protein
MKLSDLVREMLKPTQENSEAITEMFETPTAGASNGSFNVTLDDHQATVDRQVSGHLAARLAPGSLIIDMELAPEKKLVDGKLHDNGELQVGYVNGHGPLFVLSTDTFCVVSIQNGDQYAA